MFVGASVVVVGVLVGAMVENLVGSFVGAVVESLDDFLDLVSIDLPVFDSKKSKYAIY